MVLVSILSVNKCGCSGNPFAVILRQDKLVINCFTLGRAIQLTAVCSPGRYCDPGASNPSQIKFKIVGVLKIHIQLLLKTFLLLQLAGLEPSLAAGDLSRQAKDLSSSLHPFPNREQKPFILRMVGSSSFSVAVDGLRPMNCTRGNELSQTILSKYRYFSQSETSPTLTHRFARTSFNHGLHTYQTVEGERYG